MDEKRARNEGFNEETWCSLQLMMALPMGRERRWNKTQSQELKSLDILAGKKLVADSVA